MINEFKTILKKPAAIFLAALMILQSSIPSAALEKEATTEPDIVIEHDQVLSAVRAVLKKGDIADPTNFDFSGDYASEYEELFGLSEDVELYPLSIDCAVATASNASSKDYEAYLKVDYSVADEVEIGSPVGDEQIIFLFKNKKKYRKDITVEILGTSKVISLPSKDAALQASDEEDIEVATPTEISSFIDDAILTDTHSTMNIATPSNIVASSDSTETPNITEVLSAATPSNIDLPSEADEDDDADEFYIYEPAVLNNSAVVAMTCPAEDIVKEAYSTQYPFETESAVIIASVLPGTFSEPVTLEAREFDAEEEEAMLDKLRTEGNLMRQTKSFDIHFLSEDGEEVEPEKSVEISIRLKADAWPDDADPESIMVRHLSDHLDNEISSEDAVPDNADVFPESTDVFETLTSKIEKNTDSVDVRFTTDSFSYFVLSYNGFNQVWAYLYDEDGNLLPSGEIWANSVEDENHFKIYNPQDFCAKWNGGYGTADSNKKWISFSTLTSLMGDSTTGYTYLNAYTDSAMTAPFNWIYYDSDSSSWWVSTLTDKPTAAPSETDGTSRKITADTDGFMKLYIRMKNHTITSPIEDHIEESGYFLAKMPENLPEYATVNYKWYRSDDGENFEEVVRKKAANKTYNIEIDTIGSKLYPSRDTSIDVGVRRWYKAEVYVDGELYKEYSKRQVQDYPCIMNGSFENPKVSLMGNGMYDFPNGTEGLYWRTTGEDKQIEVIEKCNWAGSAYNCSSASDGTQWVELNAESNGALYQHVLVQPESTLYWRFAHRGRSGTDTMYMVIAPKNKIDSSSSTSKLVEIAKKIENGDAGYMEADGYQTLKVENGNTAWGIHEGEYTVPDNVWLLDFFFISASGTTTGNMIDDVSFSTTVPGPVAGYANITAVESLSGLLSDEMATLTMKVWLEDEDGQVATDKNGTEASKIVSFGAATEVDGVYTKTVNFANMPDDKRYTIKKVLYFNGVIDNPSGYTHTTENYVLSRNNVREQRGDGSSTSFQAYDEAKDKILVNFTDVFEIDKVPVKITKKLVGNAVEDNRDFTFTIFGTLKNGKDVAEKMSADDMSFTLKGGDSKTVEVPFGSRITIEEQDYSDDHYVTYYEIVPGETIKKNWLTIPSVTMDQEVLFTNKRAKSDVTFEKLDENGVKLAGAEFTIYKGENLTGDKIEKTFTTDASADYTTSLMTGDYTLVESNAPDGYRIADAIVLHVSESGEVTCDTDGILTVVDAHTVKVTIKNERLKGSIILENTINETYHPFGTPSFPYEITSSDGNYKKVVMLTMDSLKKNTALDLPAGDYTIKQVSVSRYTPEYESMSFTVVDGGTVKLPFKNVIKQYEKFSHTTAVVNTIGE